MSRTRALELGALAGLVLALLGLLGVLFSDGPYLGSDSIGAAIISWGLGIFALLLFAPFALYRRLGARGRDGDSRWELAIVAWGGIALAGLIGFGAIAVAEGFSGDGALGALALIAAAECALVVAGVLVMLLGGG